MEWKNGNYDRWRRRTAIGNLLIIIPIAIMIILFLVFLNDSINNMQNRTREKVKEFVKVVKEYKTVPLKTDIITKCINGKKAIIVNGEIYYAGESDIWGDIKGVDCE